MSEFAETYYTALVMMKIITISSVLISIVLIGKFFCVKVLEDIYDAWDDELSLFVDIFLVINVAFLGLSWWGYLTEIEPLMIISLVFCTLTAIANYIYIVIVTLGSYIVPTMREMHYNIKRKKRKNQ